MLPRLTSCNCLRKALLWVPKLTSRRITNPRGFARSASAKKWQVINCSRPKRQGEGNSAQIRRQREMKTKHIYWLLWLLRITILSFRTSRPQKLPLSLFTIDKLFSYQGAKAHPEGNCPRVPRPCEASCASSFFRGPQKVLINTERDEKGRKGPRPWTDNSGAHYTQMHVCRRASVYNKLSPKNIICRCICV